jgi:HEAT repeat protein
VAFAVLLLADKELRPDAIEALVKAAPTCTGQLVDALCDPRIDFHVRRRIPLVLARCPTNAAAYGLLRGIRDERFEVRHACGRALLEVSIANPEVEISLDRIVGVVTTELSREELGWDTALDADDEYAAASLVGRLRHDRLDRRVEHVFNVLALQLDPESLRTAFKALHDEDEALRGTALEYLETVLPNEVRDVVWPFLGEARPMRPARSAEEILADLRKS